MSTNILLFVILVAVVVGILLTLRGAKIMREDIRTEFEALTTELGELTSANDSILRLVEFQGEKLEEIASSDADAEEIKSRLRSLKAELDVQQNRIVNAAIAGTDAEGAEDPLPEADLDEQAGEGNRVDEDSGGLASDLGTQGGVSDGTATSGDGITGGGEAGGVTGSEGAAGSEGSAGSGEERTGQEEQRTE